MWKSGAARIAMLLSVAGLAVALTGCTRSGDVLARAAGEQAAASISSNLDRLGVPGATGEYLASTDTYVVGADVDTPAAVAIAARPVEWSGRTEQGAGATVIVRISAQVSAYSSNTIGGTDVSAGEDLSCFRIVVSAVRSDESRAERVACPTGADPSIPTDAVGPLELPDDAEALVLSALGAGDSVDAITSALTGSMPEGVVIGVQAFRGGFVAAVGATPTRGCVVGVRDADGQTRIAGGWAPEAEQAGELGCSPDLVTRPPR